MSATIEEMNVDFKGFKPGELLNDEIKRLGKIVGEVAGRFMRETFESFFTEADRLTGAGLITGGVAMEGFALFLNSTGHPELATPMAVAGAIPIELGRRSIVEGQAKLDSVKE